MSIQTVEIALPTGIDSVTVGLAEPISIVEVRQGPAGPAGSAVIDAATQSDGTADLDLLNVETVTATVTGTLTAPHIHGNLAGSVYAHIRAGEALEKGDPVYVSGSFGSGSTLIPIVSKADASNAAKMPAVGIMDADVANNNTGHMVITGTITELDTAGLTVNAELYVAAGGGMTATPPTARAQPVARVERVNANNGAVIVKVNGLSASDATANTLVRRTSGGGASFAGINTNSGSYSQVGGANFNVATTTAANLTATGSGTVTVSGAGGTTISGGTLTFSPSGFAYGAGAASAHRTALGLGTGDSPTFAGAVFAGHVTMSAANTYDIGGLSGTKPRDICADRILQVAGAGSIRFEGRGRLTCDSFNKITVINPSSVLVDFGAANLTASGTLSVTGASTFGGLIEQRNGTAAQESRIYGTYTDGSNYRRLALKMSTAGVAQIVAEGAGSGSTGNVLQLPSNTTFADLTATRAALGIQTKTGTSTGLAAVGTTDITGLTGYALEADTWYKLELQYMWTSASSNFQINFFTTGTFLRGGTTAALGQSMSSAAALSTTVFVNDTTFALRGSVGETRTNLPAFGYAYFKTGTAGTGNVQLQLLAGTTLSTIVSSCAVLTKQQ